MIKNFDEMIMNVVTGDRDCSDIELAYTAIAFYMRQNIMGISEIMVSQEDENSISYQITSDEDIDAEICKLFSNLFGDISNLSETDIANDEGTIIFKIVKSNVNSYYFEYNKGENVTDEQELSFAKDWIDLLNETGRFEINARGSTLRESECCYGVMYFIA